jgi:hypothetical protein
VFVIGFVTEMCVLIVTGAERRYGATKRGRGSVKSRVSKPTNASASVMSKWLGGSGSDVATASASSVGEEGSGTDDDVTMLLVLDPAVSGWSLGASLERCMGWERHVKRGEHTLKKPEYQVQRRVASVHTIGSLTVVLCCPARSWWSHGRHS